MGTSCSCLHWGPRARPGIMAFKAIVVATLVALVSAGMDRDYMNYMNQMNMMNMMNQMNMMQNMGGMQHQQQQQHGCNPNSPTGGCQLAQGIDLGDYLQTQMQQQQYESQQMAEKVKAQFEAVMREVTMKKHKYAMSVMTEYTALCACLGQTYNIYQTMFVENARAANLTDIDDLSQYNKPPYQATSAKEARELIFGGMVNALCTSLGTFMNFAQQVENNIPIFQNNQGTTPSPGK